MGCIYFFELWFSPDIYSEGQLMDHMIGSIPSFFLELFLLWSPVAYWAPTDLGISSFSVLSFCLFILFMGFSGKNTEVVCHSLLQWTTLCQTSPPWPDCYVAPHAWLSFTELDKAVVLWSDWLIFCDYGFILSALCCPLATPNVSLGCLWPRTWAISSWLLQQSAAAAPYLGCGVSPHGCTSWPWMWGSYSRLLLHCAAAVGNKGKMEKNGKKNAKKQNGCLRNPHK